MTGASLKPKIVRVTFEQGKTGLLYATSPDLKGLLVAKRTIEALEDAIPSAVADLYAASGVKVIVTRAEETQGELSPPWIAFPAELARQALADP